MLINIIYKWSIFQLTSVNPNKIPMLVLKQEKNLLQLLPQSTIRDSYRIKHTLVKVNASNMIYYKSNQYSVPAKYQRKTPLATSIGIATAKKRTSISLNVMIYFKILNMQK